MKTLFNMVGEQFKVCGIPFGELEVDLLYFWNAYDEAIK